MVLAQSPIDWASTLEHSVTIGVLLFGGYGLAWVAVKLFGKGGYTERMNDTLSDIKDLVGNQQVLCTKHAGAVERMCVVEETLARTVGEAVVAATSDRKEISDNVDRILDHTTKTDMWGRQNVDEYRVIPALDAMLAAVDTAERVAGHCNHADEVVKEIRDLKHEVVEIKARIRGDRGD